MKHSTRTACVALILVAVAPAPAPADPFEDGLAAYGQGNYATALRLWRPLAERGDPGAQYRIGRLYEEGRGVPEDDAEAVGWYRKAAAQGHIKAQHTLGLMYASGESVPQDYVQAYAWWTLAAENGRQEAKMLRDALKLRMTSAQLAEGKKLARTWSLP
ncbi:MAG: tetratricopeptide repeat protein [Chromatiales bacterium]